MTSSRIRRSLAALVATGLVLAACGDDDSGDEPDDTEAPADAEASADSAATEDTDAMDEEPVDSEATEDTDAMDDESAEDAGGEAASLAEVCPETIVIQTDWFPEAEHGALYEMVGDDYEIDDGNLIVSGSLVTEGGANDTGVDIEVRTGGPAIGDQTVAAVTYADPDITLAYANTEAQVLQTDTPLISVVAPLEINPQIIYWDPETYPEIETLADLGEEGVEINVFAGGTFSEVFVGNGTWTEDQVNPSYDGSPARFIAEEGAIAQQGFASAEPYSYEFEFEEWGKPVAFQLLHDAGFEVYSQTIAVPADKLEDLSPCLTELVPIIQQAAIDYVNDPARANGIIIDAVATFDSFWVYDEGLAEYSAETQAELGLVGNGPDDTLGNMEEERIQTVIDQIRDDAGLDVPADLVAADLFTNEFIDDSIGF